MTNRSETQPSKSFTSFFSINQRLRVIYCAIYASFYISMKNYYCNIRRKWSEVYNSRFYFIITWKELFIFHQWFDGFFFLLSMTEKISVQLLIVERKIISSICHAHEVDERSVHITVCKFLNNLWRGAAASSFSSLSFKSRGRGAWPNWWNSRRKRIKF